MTFLQLVKSNLNYNPVLYTIYTLQLHLFLLSLNTIIILSIPLSQLLKKTLPIMKLKTDSCKISTELLLTHSLFSLTMSFVST